MIKSKIETAREANARRVRKFRERKKEAELQASQNRIKHEVELSHNKKQNQLFNDPRRLIYIRSLEEINPEIAAKVSWIFQGAPAQCSKGQDHQLVSVVQHMSQTSQARPPRIMVLSDRIWYEGRPHLNWTEFMQHLASTPDRAMSSQELKLSTSEIETHQLPAKIVVERMEHHGNNPNPINLLNLPCRVPNLVPPAIAKHCTLLPEACEAILSEENIAYGLEKSIQFMLCGQAGFFTGWHMDNNGLATWVTIEKGSGNGQEEDGEVLKYWAVVELDNLSPETQNAAKNDFAKYGTNWRPDPSWIRVFSLVPGVTLIMPGGTIHAVISLTNCLIRGGMFWDRKTFVTHTLPAWKFIARNRDMVTNEDPSKQIIEILQWLRADVRRNPEAYDVRAAGVPSVDGIIQDILDASAPCKCKRKCGSDCLCLARGLRCYQDCTPRHCANV